MKSRYLITLVVIIVLAAALYALTPRSKHEPGQVFCAQDAKQCPDGTYVGRVAPSCDFAPCLGGQPQTEPIPADWKTEQSEGFIFRYPETLGTQYLATQVWPPIISLTVGAPACADSEQRVINNHHYCVQTQTDAAAGSAYTTYTFTTMKNGKLARAEFTLRQPGCYNYDEPRKSACENEQQTFNIEPIIDQIIQSIQ